MPGGRPFESDLNEHGLTPGQEMFCQEYCLDFNCTQAAIRAGYSENSAYSTGSDLYRRPYIRERIRAILADRRKEYDVTVGRLEKEIARIAFADPSEIFDEALSVNGKLVVKSLKDIPKRLRPVIKSLKPTKDGIHVTFHDKVGAMDMLAKHFGYYEADNEQKKPPAGVAITIPTNGRGDEKLPPSYEGHNTGEMLG